MNNKKIILGCIIAFFLMLFCAIFIGFIVLLTKNQKLNEQNRFNNTEYSSEATTDNAKDSEDSSKSNDDNYSTEIGSDKLAYNLKFKNRSVQLIFDKSKLNKSGWKEQFTKETKILNNVDNLNDAIDDMQFDTLYYYPNSDSILFVEPSSMSGFYIVDDLQDYLDEKESNVSYDVTDDYYQVDYSCDIKDKTNSRKQQFIELQCLSTYSLYSDGQEFTEELTDCGFKLKDGKYLVFRVLMKPVHSEPNMCDMLSSAGLIEVK